MSVRKAFWTCFIMLSLVLQMLFYFGNEDMEGSSLTGGDVETIRIWYTDEEITDYLNSAAVTYLERYGVRVIPELHSALEYMDAINDVSVSGEDVPDLYIVGTDYIERAAMSGLALPVLDEKNVLNQMYYPEVAVNAVTYEGKKFGYPFYYQTAFLLYNETYLKMMADSTLRAALNETEEAEETEADEDENEGEAITVSANEAPPEGYTAEEWNAIVEEKVETMIPTSIQDILEFANNYQAPANVENFFLWDVSDIFYNYFFAGSYMNVGGVNGDDRSIIDIYNEDTVECMLVYQDLNEYFSIDASTSSYQSVLDTFINGETIFMIATTDAFAALDQAAFEGNFDMEYSVAPLPGVDSDHTATGLSSTSAVIVNGYTCHRDSADAFARFITYDFIDTFNARTGKLPTVSGTEDYIIDVTDLARDMYRQSVPLPKLIELNNFWVELELAYTLIWEGEDVETTLSDLQEKMESQLAQ